MAGKVLATLGIVLHVVIGVFPFGASGLLAPAWGIAVLYLIWVALLVVAIRVARDPDRRKLTPLVPVAAIVVWFAVMTAGDLALGWTA